MGTALAWKGGLMYSDDPFKLLSWCPDPLIHPAAVNLQANNALAACFWHLLG